MAINLEQKAGESTEKYYRRLAKMADQRLVRLEALQHEEGYRNVTKWSYERAMKDIQKWSGEGAKRFNTKLPGAIKGGEPATLRDKQRIMAKIGDIKTFLESPTSTKKRITEVYKKRADTINKKYGTDFTWEHLGNFFESKSWEKMDSTYGSSTKLRAIGAVQRLGSDKAKRALSAKINAEYEKKKAAGDAGLTDPDVSKDSSIVDLIKAANEYNVKIANDSEVNNTIKRWLKEDGVDFEELIK